MSVPQNDQNLNLSILRRELLAKIIKRKFGGHACTKIRVILLRHMPGERKRGTPSGQYIDNIKKLTRASLEENARVTEDRTA